VKDVCELIMDKNEIHLTVSDVELQVTCFYGAESLSHNHSLSPFMESEVSLLFS
jgi:hypothetical protein